MQRTEFDINTLIYVKLKPEGAALLPQVDGYTPQGRQSGALFESDHAGWYGLPLWVFMQTFAQSLSCRADSPVLEMELRLDTAQHVPLDISTTVHLKLRPEGAALLPQTPLEDTAGVPAPHYTPDQDGWYGLLL